MSPDFIKKIPKEWL